MTRAVHGADRGNIHARQRRRHFRRGRKAQLVVIAAAQCESPHFIRAELVLQRRRYRHRVEVYIRSGAACRQEFLQIAEQAVRDIDGGTGDTNQFAAAVDARGWLEKSLHEIFIRLARLDTREPAGSIANASRDVNRIARRRSAAQQCATRFDVARNLHADDDVIAARRVATDKCDNVFVR